MIIPFVGRAATLESVRERATDGVSSWLFRIVDRMPGIIPERASPVGGGTAGAEELRRFVRDSVTRNPTSRSPISSIQIDLIELALDCVDWPELAAHPRLRELDWARARLVRPCP